jgi:hypothetical protein
LDGGRPVGSPKADQETDATSVQEKAMLRKTLFLVTAVALATLLTSSEARAWGVSQGLHQLRRGEL